MTNLKTKERLVEALKGIGAEELAKNAESGMYDELESLLQEPLAQLTFELGKINTEASNSLAQEVLNGEYYASADEITQLFGKTTVL
jgi:hypothetical protein